MRFRKQKPQEVPAESVDAATTGDDTAPDAFPDISAGLAVLSKYQAMTGPREVLRKPNRVLEWSDFD